MQEGPTVFIGTTKGAFLLQGDAARSDWRLRGPFCELWPINHAACDHESGHIWAVGGGEWQGAGVWRSTDGGETWTLTKLACGQADVFLRDNPELSEQLGMSPTSSAPFDGQIDALWSVCRADGRLFAGAKPATLFASDDDGASWVKLTGLSDHPGAGEWQPGAAGLTLHTIIAHPDDPARLWVGISAAGVFATEDGGTTWEHRIRRANAPAAAGDHPAAGSQTEIGGCVHNMVRAGGEGGDLLYQQNHHGVFRSRDGARNWQDITNGLPSTFGFPISVHPRDPETIWTVPLNGDSAGRYPPDARAAVWRSRDGGDSWQDCRSGLPGENCFFTVLRQAMAVDRSAPAGVYFGTNSGSVFATRDEGDTWAEIARHLPTILCVETL